MLSSSAVTDKQQLLEQFIDCYHRALEGSENFHKGVVNAHAELLHMLPEYCSEEQLEEFRKASDEHLQEVAQNGYHLDLKELMQGNMQVNTFPNNGYEVETSLEQMEDSWKVFIMKLSDTETTLDSTAYDTNGDIIPFMEYCDSLSSDERRRLIRVKQIGVLRYVLTSNKYLDRCLVLFGGEDSQS